MISISNAKIKCIIGKVLDKRFRESYPDTDYTALTHSSMTREPLLLLKKRVNDQTKYLYRRFWTTVL